jgi:anti-sigma-K factor RskA
MTLRFTDWDDRTFDLAFERFTVGLDREKSETLDRTTDRDQLDELESVVTAIHLGHLAIEAPPVELLSSIEAMGRLQLANAGGSAPAPQRAPRTRSALLTWSGWLTAAAILLFVALGTTSDTDAVTRRAELLASATDAIRLDWNASEDPAAVEATGDVVWSKSRQEGYLRFERLEPNDPTRAQYQLWIFDPTRADWEAKPVDGGVFDVSAEGEVVVPIDAKLEIRDTAMFAVTLEVPGGVVVSERERIVLAAAL